MSNGDREKTFEALLEYLRDSRGFDFTGYKRASLTRRVEKRMQEVALKSFSDYRDYLEVHPEEFALLFNTILINVTAFFRDKAAWDYLAAEIVPRILARKEPSEHIRVWSVGTASGEEAYTIAMVLAEAIGVDAFRERVKLYATDVDDAALAQARRASYGPKAIEPVPPQLRKKYFTLRDGQYVFSTELRRTVIFGRHDIVQDSPISRLDLLLCRNTLMYFNAETQRRVIARFHFAIKDTGYLFLGKAEMLLTHAGLFAPVDLKHRIFAKVGVASPRDSLLALARSGDEHAMDLLDKSVRLRDVAFDSAAEAHVVVDADGRLAVANTQARGVFGIRQEDLGRPFHDLELSYKPVELSIVIERAIAARVEQTIGDVERKLPGGETQYFDVRVVPLLSSASAPLGVSVVFLDVTQHKRLGAELSRSKTDLAAAYEDVQSANAELTTTNEELQSTVEELETTNEELQSSNEELETMNEELQSTNTEMEAMNSESLQRTADLDASNAFLQATLGSVPSGVVVLDRQADVLVWNEQAANTWGLRADEAAHKPFFSLDIGLPTAKLQAVVKGIIDGTSEREVQTLEAVNRRGRTIKVRVTCTRFVGADRTNQGAVLLMEEVEQ